MYKINSIKFKFLKSSDQILTVLSESPEVKLPQDSSNKNGEKLEKKSQKEKTKSFITKKKEVEVQPQRIEQQNNVQEEKEIEKILWYL